VKRPHVVATVLGAVALAACAVLPTPPPIAPPTTPLATIAASATTEPKSTAIAATTTPTAVPPSATPTITPTPAPVARQLTSGGCCVQPAWSPDGQEVWYLDRPSEAAPSGLWGVSAEGGEPRFITDKLGIYSPDRALFAYPQAGQTFIEQAADGTRWTVPANGRAISFSPDGTRIAWQVASSSINFDRRSVEIWVANVDGSAARRVAAISGGGLGDWLPDGQRLLVSGRDSGDRVSFFATVNVDDGSLVTVLEAPNLRGGQVSPGGGWLAYQVAFSGDATQNGLWVLPLAGGAPLRLSVFGALRWRSEGQLLVIPLEPGQAQRLVEIDAATGTARDLTDPAVTPLRIAGGDWALSPEGRRVVYVSADDHNLWLLELPE
jgi:hypothetical protein